MATDKGLTEKGERFKQVREKLKYADDQAGFGEFLGKKVNPDGKPIDISTISRYETGKLAVSNKVLLVFFSSLGINKQWWETGEGEMFTAPSAHETPPTVKESDVPYKKPKTLYRRTIDK